MVFIGKTEEIDMISQGEYTEIMMEGSIMSRNYTAFISYRHKPLDISVAEKLQRMIERYRIPRALRKNGQAHLGLVFRDRDELPLSNHLTQDIYTALDHSQYLIVVCTPDTPHSLWVRQEIEYFIKQHGRHRILTVLAAGTAEESIPDIITTTYDEDGKTVLDVVEPMCAYLSDDTPKKVLRNLKTEFLRLVAAILECPYDALYQRRKKYVRRLATAAVGGTVAILLTVIALLVGWNRDVTALNEQITQQLRDSQFRESQVVAMLSRQELEAGNKSDVVLQDILSVLPSENNDRAYAPDAVKVLSEFLGVYDVGSYGFGKSIQHNAEIVSMYPSPDGRDILVIDTLGYVTLYDLQSGNRKWEIMLSYYSGLTQGQVGAVEFRSADNQIMVSFMSTCVYLDYTTGQELDIEYKEEGWSDYRSTRYTQSDVDCVAHYSGEERIISFCDMDGNLLAQTDMLPQPHNSEYVKAGYLLPLPPNLELYGQCFADGAYVCALYEQDEETWEQRLYFVIVDDYTTCDKVTTHGPYSIGADPSLSLMYSREKGKIICVYDEWIIVVYEAVDDSDVYYNVWEDAVCYETKSAALVGWLQDDDLVIAQENGNILRCALDEIWLFEQESETLFDVGDSLAMGVYSDGVLYAISKDVPYHIMTVQKQAGGQDGKLFVEEKSTTEAWHRIFPVPQQNAVVVFSSWAGTEEGLPCHVSVCDAETFAPLREFDVTIPLPKDDLHYSFDLYDDQGNRVLHYAWDEYSVYSHLLEQESVYTCAYAYGVTSDGTALIVNTYLLNLSNGELTAFDEKDYEQGSLNGFTPQYAPYARGQGLVTAAFETSTDVLTWWVDGENPKNTVCPLNVWETDQYEDELAVGGNGLILLRYYGKDDLMIGGSVFPSYRKVLSYAVFSAQQEKWKVFDNPCTEYGVAKVGLAEKLPLFASMDYDGMLRIYDWDANEIAHTYAVDIAPRTVTQVLFAQQDEVVLICHATNKVTAVRVSDGAVLGEFTMDNKETTTLQVCEFPELRQLYLYAADGSVTGIGICTENWGTLIEVPHMFSVLPEQNCLLRWSEDGAELIVSPVYSVEALVAMGQEKLNQSAS